MMRLHLFSGEKYWPGFVNCDKHVASADRVIDCVKLPEIEDGAADEIYVIHGLEHLHRLTAERALREWARVLRVGGRLVLELPSLDKIVALLAAGEENLRLTLLGLYGDPREPREGMEHRWCWSRAELAGSLAAAGFDAIKFQEPSFHIPARDMRATAYKSNPEGADHA